MVIDALKSIEPPYRRPIKGNYYERPLCYEFYHQFRLRINDKQIQTRFVLTGELDKRYIKISRTPDFIFHVPGKDENFAVMEFRNARYGRRNIESALKKLEDFKKEPKLKYKIAILVIFGNKRQLKRIRSILDGRTDEVITIIYDVEDQEAKPLSM